MSRSMLELEGSNGSQQGDPFVAPPTPESFGKIITPPFAQSGEDIFLEQEKERAIRKGRVFVDIFDAL